MSYTRVSIKLCGVSGQGINTTGKILAKSLANSHYKIFAYREYPSLIKGGFASYQIDFSNKEINSSVKKTNILISFIPQALNEYINDVADNGIIIYNSQENPPTEEQLLSLKEKNILVVFLDSKSIAKASGGTEIMANVVILGFLWKLLHLDLEILEETILKFFEKKAIDIEAEKKCISSGYDSPTYRPELSQKIILPKTEIFSKNYLTMPGNSALALGAIACGVRAYYAYPMTPATTIFKFLGDTANETKILVKQAENEITAIQLALGSMYMGTRAFVGTSGGGFDLMIETLSCAGITETPLVIVLSQRTGAGTGVPTWTGAGDLNTAIKSGHGEFPRCILSVSDAESSYTLIQKAFNIAEKYQIPVIVLSEKQISESLFSLKSLPKNLPIERGLQEGPSRYQITENGISPRWIPSKEKKPYLNNSDEHQEDGTSTENSEEIVKMAEKRMRKLDALIKELPEPQLYGSKNSKTIFVGYGSSKNTVLDAMKLDKNIGYLHYEYLHPLKTKPLEELINHDRRLVLIENNQSGQFGKLIKEQTGFDFKEKLLKYDARPFFLENILNFLEK